RVRHLLGRIYGREAETALNRILPLIETYGERRPAGNAPYFSQDDVVLITYGDILRKSGESPLATFHRFARRYLREAISTIHFLPFFPYSSDDGFSVIDFRGIDPELGTWEDVSAVGNDFRLMFDYVVNHFSAKSQWFERYLAGAPGFEDFAIEVDPAADLSLVTRPRSLPLLSRFEKQRGESVHLWTTFSADQIDFNFKSLDVLETMIDVLFFYARQGAGILRLDAIAYLWKEIGTSCIHLPQTHDMVRLFRALLDIVAPDVMILTETNVPHPENISYFGDGRNEAQMVYNFSLPPLLLHAFIRQDTAVLSEWARGLRLPSPDTAFFNFTASHDGIGVRPLEGLLPPGEIDALVRVVEAVGGKVSTRRHPDGSDTPYELNATYVDAILGDPSSERAEKFLASQAIQYALPGVPATYIHSLMGSRNWTAGVEQTGRARTINREKPDVDRVTAALADPGSFRSRVFFPYLRMISTRRRQKAFHPNASFEVLDLDPRVFAIKRFCDGQTVLALTNVSEEIVSVQTAGAQVPGLKKELISGSPVDIAPKALGPYQSVWLSDS
ncbi:MAG: alpha-amylase family glycosyl hydrolase, partial [Desulfobacterales bacterium]